MSIPVDQFAKIVGGEAHGFAPDAFIAGFATDNREVHPGDLFLAIEGERVDGHDFAADAVARGAVGALVEHLVNPSLPQVLVPNLVVALAQFGKHYRNQFAGPVIGVTGSAGKTTAKEFIAAALSPLGPIVKTEGNRNTEYTAPLMWAGLEPPSTCRMIVPGGGRGLGDGGSGSFETRAAVVEMAMRGFGQIRHLAEIASPTIAVVTNIGYSHMSEVGSRDGIARAKAELLESLPREGIAILWQEDDYLGFLKSKAPGRVVTFGYSDEADVRIAGYKSLSWTASEVTFRVAGSENGQPSTQIAQLPTVGRHIALGAAAAMAVAIVLGVPPADAAKALEEARLPPLRMEVIERDGVTILLDTYNAAPPSMIGAIETFAELPCNGRRLAVIGEMRELGPYSDQAHRDLGIVLAKSGIDEAIFYSGPAALAMEEARMHGLVVHWADSLKEVGAFIDSAKPGDAVLVKGSRSLELEKTIPREDREV